MGKISTAIDIAKKIFSKKKPKEIEKFKTDTSKYPTTKNIDDLIKNEQDPFVRNKLISMKKSRARGDVKDKGGNIMGTPNKERSAESIERYVQGAKKGGRMGYSVGGKAIRGVSKILMKK